MTATEIAREIAASTSPAKTCRLLVEYAKGQPRGEGDDPILLASLRTLAEVRKSRPRADVLSASRARPYGPWLRVTALLERLTAWRAGGAL